MKLTVLQPNFFPFKTYFDIIEKVDKVVFVDDTFYNSKCWVNKSVIKRNGVKTVFRIPIIETPENKKISDLTTPLRNWRKNFLRFTSEEYRDSINFSKVFPLIKEVVNLPTDSVSMISAYGIFRISDLLGYKASFALSSINYKQFHGSFYKKISKICKHEGIKHFFTFAMYRNTFESDFFLRNKIAVSYTDTSAQSNYSIIDHLMNSEDLLKK